MPSLSQLPDGIKQKKFLKALEKVGFRISTKGGNGSHCKAIWTNEKSVTIQYDLRKDMLYVILKEIKVISGVDWDEIKKHL